MNQKTKEDFLYFLGDSILGDYAFVAHGFMFAMGVGMIYSRKGNQSDLACQPSIIV